MAFYSLLNTMQKALSFPIKHNAKTVFFFTHCCDLLTETEYFYNPELPTF